VLRIELLTMETFHTTLVPTIRCA